MHERCFRQGTYLTKCGESSPPRLPLYLWLSSQSRTGENGIEFCSWLKSGTGTGWHLCMGMCFFVGPDDPAEGSFRNWCSCLSEPGNPDLCQGCSDFPGLGGLGTSWALISRSSAPVSHRCVEAMNMLRAQTLFSHPRFWPGIEGMWSGVPE